MRPDQIEQLNDLAEKLADVFLTEADPSNWSGDGRLPADMTPQERGDRHWDRKGAMGTGGVLQTTINLHKHYTERAAAGIPGTDTEEADLDKKIRAAEKKAAAAMERVMGKAMADGKARP